MRHLNEQVFVQNDILPNTKNEFSYFSGAKSFALTCTRPGLRKKVF